MVSVSTWYCSNIDILQACVLETCNFIGRTNEALLSVVFAFCFILFLVQLLNAFIVICMRLHNTKLWTIFTGNISTYHYVYIMCNCDNLLCWCIFCIPLLYQKWRQYFIFCFVGPRLDQFSNSSRSSEERAFRGSSFSLHPEKSAHWTLSTSTLLHWWDFPGRWS